MEGDECVCVCVGGCQQTVRLFSEGGEGPGVTTNEEKRKNRALRKGVFMNMMNGSLPLSYPFAFRIGFCGSQVALRADTAHISRIGGKKKKGDK